ncbi:hypothetical protein WA158_001688 [Blastocystis sp. Blastoise]
MNSTQDEQHKWVPTEKDIENRKKRKQNAEERNKLFEGKSKEEIDEIRKRIKAERESREKKLQDSLQNGQRICIDANYWSTMSALEQGSLIKQLSLCHRENKHAEIPLAIHVCGMTPQNCELLKNFGGEKWAMNFHEEPIEKVFSPAEMIYMSPDGTQILDTINTNKVYIIGGIVDRTVNKNLSCSRADSLHIPTFRLPINEYLPNCKKPVLNVNTMIELFIHMGMTHDWSQSFKVCIPKRKLNTATEYYEYDYHNIKDHIENGIQGLSMKKLLKYQLIHHLHIYCQKKNINYSLKTIDRFKDGYTKENRFECIIKVDNNIYTRYSSPNSRYSQSVASYYTLISLEKEYGLLDIKKNKDNKDNNNNNNISDNNNNISDNNNNNNKEEEEEYEDNDDEIELYDSESDSFSDL